VVVSGTIEFLGVEESVLVLSSNCMSMTQCLARDHERDEPTNTSLCEWRS